MSVVCACAGFSLLFAATILLAIVMLLVIVGEFFFGYFLPLVNAGEYFVSISCH